MKQKVIGLLWACGFVFGWCIVGLIHFLPGVPHDATRANYFFLFFQFHYKNQIGHFFGLCTIGHIHITRGAAGTTLGQLLFFIPSFSL